MFCLGSLIFKLDASLKSLTPRNTYVAHEVSKKFITIKKTIYNFLVYCFFVLYAISSSFIGVPKLL